MKLYYKTNRHSLEITPVTVERETEKTLWINGRQTRRYGNYETFHYSFDSAKKHLLIQAEIKMRRAQAMMTQAKRDLREIKALEETQNQEEK